MNNKILISVKCAVVTLLLAIGVPLHGQFKSYEKVSDFHSSGYAVVCNNFRMDNQLMGVIDENGREIVPLKYYKVEIVDDEVAVATNNGNEGKKALLSLKTGKEITAFKYNEISFDHGFGLAQTENGNELIDSKGQIIKGINLELATYMGDGFIRNFVDEDNIMFYHQNGTPISNKIFKNVYDFQDFEAGQENGWIQVWLPDAELEENFSHWLCNDGTLLSNNDYLTKVKYKNRNYYVRYNDEMNEMEVVSTKDGTIHTTFKADEYICTENKIIIRKDGLYGLIDYDGNEIIKCNFKAINDFSEGMAYAKSDQGEEYFIDINGNKVVNYTGKFTKYDYKTEKRKEKNSTTSHSVSNSPSFSEGLAPFKSNERIGFINKNGEVVIPAQYKNVGPFTDGYAIVQDEQSQKYGMINKSGNIVLPCIYEACNYSTKGYAIVTTSVFLETFIKLEAKTK